MVGEKQRNWNTSLLHSFFARPRRSPTQPSPPATSSRVQAQGCSHTTAVTAPSAALFSHTFPSSSELYWVLPFLQHISTELPSSSLMGPPVPQRGPAKSLPKPPGTHRNMPEVAMLSTGQPWPVLPSMEQTTQHSLAEEGAHTNVLSTESNTAGQEGELTGVHEPPDRPAAVQARPSQWSWFLIAATRKFSVLAGQWQALSVFPEPRTAQGETRLENLQDVT